MCWENRIRKKLIAPVISMFSPKIHAFQGYQLCVLDYDFMILNNAFLIHRPGIKSKADSLNQTQKKKVAGQNTLISKTIMPELKKIFGERKGCVK